MSTLESGPPQPTSTHPYLIRALYEWCAHNGLTPHITVQADETVQVPREFVHDGQIVLNISADATNALILGNDYIRFKARFGGLAHEVIIPVDRVMAIYARENGQGMAFGPPPPLNPYQALPKSNSTPAPDSPRGGIRLVSTTPAAPGDGDDHEPPPSTPPRPTLKRVK